MSAAQPSNGRRTRRKRGRYFRVFDEITKRPIRGLWKRNESFYAQMTFTNPDGEKETKRTRLEASTVPQARKELEKLRTKRDEGFSPPKQRTIRFDLVVDEYFKLHQIEGLKRSKTLQEEKYRLDHWKEKLGSIAVSKIDNGRVENFVRRRQEDGAGARTINLDVAALRAVLKFAVSQGHITRLPFTRTFKLEYKPKEIIVPTLEEIEKVCRAAVELSSQRGQLVSDFIKLMAFAGSRRSETLRLRWEDVDWSNRVLTIGADGLAKSGKSRRVQFNEKLDRHLRDMEARRRPDLPCLFPNPPGAPEQQAPNLGNFMRMARKKAGVLKFHFHSCRHYFASACVKAGIDFKTISEWLGHSDGGILVAKTYGHVDDKHKQAAAAKIKFE